MLGAVAEAPIASGDRWEGTSPECSDLMYTELGEGLTMVLVLGVEGRELRTLVVKTCSRFVRILKGLGKRSNLIVRGTEEQPRFDHP